MQQLHLIDALSRATVDAPAAAYVQVQPMSIRRTTRMSVFHHPTSSITFAGLALGRRPALRFGTGVKQAAWGRIRSPIILRITAIDQRGREHTVFQQTIDPGHSEADRRWFDHTIALAQFQKQAVALRFETLLPAGYSGEYCWSGWSDPVIEHEIKPVAPTIRRDTHYHVVLITSDALRADYLGCYGHPIVKTPHLDRLAADGCLFTHARVQSSTSLGSFACLLTSRYCAEHGLVSEWGRIPPGFITLPQHLARQGYHTVIAPSEAEVGEDPKGMISLFAETIPCLAIPAQSGDITTRQFIQWLDARPNAPFFAWLQYFDTHPPATPPEPYRSMYYQGDPTDSIRAFHAERVPLVRGMESVAEILCNLPRLEQGVVDSNLLRRLEVTADVLTGKAEVGADLAVQLKALGNEARLGMDVKAFGQWLADQTARLRQGQVSPEMIQWLRHILGVLLEVETEILSWLEGVVDYRYPLSQYMAEVTHLDAHVGQVVEALKARGIYDHTTIVFTSPHGESLTELGTYFHHHLLSEEVLRVPAIIKAGDVAGIPRGARIDGILDSIDLFPTILDAVKAAHPPSLRGVSRWPQVCSGAAIDVHDSVAENYNRNMIALARGSMVYWRALADQYLSQEWDWREGQTALYELHQPMSYGRNLVADRPGEARQMQERMNEWMHQVARPVSDT